jgi:WD40 repeat protein
VAEIELEKPIRLKGRNSVSAMSFSPSNSKIAVASWDGFVYIIEAENGKIRLDWQLRDIVRPSQCPGDG